MTSLSWQIFAAVQVITRLQRQVCEIALNQRAAHTRHLLEIVKGFERAILFTIADDGLRFFRPTPFITRARSSAEAVLILTRVPSSSMAFVLTVALALT